MANGRQGAHKPAIFLSATKSERNVHAERHNLRVSYLAIGFLHSFVPDFRDAEKGDRSGWESGPLAMAGDQPIWFFFFF